MSHRKTIINAAANIAYASSWADWMEEQGESVRGEIMDQAPSTPLAAKKWAAKLIRMMEKFNHKSIDAMYDHALKLTDTHGSRASATNFGHMTAMQALGHGVSWSDNNPEHGFRIPHSEFHCFGEGKNDCHGSVSDRPGIGSVG